MNKPPYYDEAQWLLACADEATDGAASKDPFVFSAGLAGDVPDLILSLRLFAEDLGIDLPELSEYPG